MVGRSSGGRRRSPFWISGQCQLWLALSSVAWWRSGAEELRPGSLITRARLIGNNSIITQKPDQQKPQTQKTPSNSKPGHQSKVLRTKLKLPTSVRLWQLFLCGQPTKWVLLKDPPTSHTRKGVSWPTSANRIALFRRVWYGMVWYGVVGGGIVWYGHMHAAGNDLGTLSSSFHHFHIHTVFGPAQDSSAQACIPLGNGRWWVDGKEVLSLGHCGPKPRVSVSGNLDCPHTPELFWVFFVTRSTFNGGVNRKTFSLKSARISYFSLWQAKPVEKVPSNWQLSGAKR